jgi:hypothetical protein
MQLSNEYEVLSACQKIPSFASLSFVTDQSGYFTYLRLFGFCFVSKVIEKTSRFLGRSYKKKLRTVLDPILVTVFRPSFQKVFFLTKQC